MSNTNFKAGDRVEFVKDYGTKGKEFALAGDKFTVERVENDVYDISGQLVYMQGKEDEWGAYGSRLKLADKFSKGDKVIVTTYPWAKGKVATVTNPHRPFTGSATEYCVAVQLDGDERLFYEKDLELAPTGRAFSKGDIVALKDQGSYEGAWSGPMTITYVWAASFGCDHPQRGVGAFNDDALEAYEETVVVEEETTEAKPVTFRIAVNGQIGNKEYATLEELKEAAREFGGQDETFTVFEVCEVATFRVEVTKTLVETR
jgi:hypothetical protein